ncbi:MAG: hypothetical protein AAF934_02310, partial [Bacteroidota bacterium]
MDLNRIGEDLRHAPLSNSLSKMDKITGITGKRINKTILIKKILHVSITNPFFGPALNATSFCDCLLIAKTTGE